VVGFLRLGGAGGGFKTWSGNLSHFSFLKLPFDSDTDGLIFGLVLLPTTNIRESESTMLRNLVLLAISGRLDEQFQKRR
jgi:hypothetical protein